MKAKNLLKFGLILLATLFSCKKEDGNSGNSPCAGEETIAYINSIDLQNCKYKTNSYWVYVDSVNNSFDSVSIVSFEQGFIEDMCENSFETHSFRTSSSLSSELTNYVVVAGGLFKDFGGSPNSGTQIYNDFDITSSMTNFQIQKYDSLLIYDEYYKRVLRVEIATDPTENQDRSIYFINSEFGLLKHNIYSDNILTASKILMRKNIER